MTWWAEHGHTVVAWGLIITGAGLTIWGIRRDLREWRE